MKILRTTLIAILVCAAVAWFAREPVLFAAGQLLVNDQPPAAADMIIVPGGDWAGHRITRAAELARAGFAPRVYVSGAGGLYDLYEADVAVAYAVRHGYPRDLFIPDQYPALSTYDEAHHIIPRIRTMGVRRIIVVTSIWHTARVHRVYTREAPDLDIETVGAPDPVWGDGHWWRDREGRKTFYFEVSKSVGDFLRL